MVAVQLMQVKVTQLILMELLQFTPVSYLANYILLW